MTLRRVVAALAVVVLAACSNPDETERADAEPTTTTVTLAPAEPYRVAPGEPEVEIKQAAVDVLTALGTYDQGEGTTAAAYERVGTLLAPGSLPSDAPLLGPGPSAVDIIYPQLGGLTNTQASVMVIVAHRTIDAGTVNTVVRTVDVRIARHTHGPIVSGFGSFGGEPTGPAALSPLAQSVLDNGRIDLPDSSRWDIGSGETDERILQLLSDLAVTYELGITVLRSGHPTNVFATEHTSNHTKGRGVDIWAINGQPVAAIQNTPVLRRLIEAMVQRGVTEVGSPIDIDGPGGPSFTNTVHQDHIHLAYDT